MFNVTTSTLPLPSYKSPITLDLWTLLGAQDAPQTGTLVMELVNTSVQ